MWLGWIPASTGRGGCSTIGVTDRGTITRDIRDVRPDDLRGFDAVVHLAELSNDPLGAHNPEITYDIGFQAR